MNDFPLFYRFFPQILVEFKKHVQNHPRTFGNKASLTHPKFKELMDLEREACRIVQLATGTLPRDPIPALSLTTYIL